MGRLALFLLLWAPLVSAAEFRLLELDKLEVTGYQFKPGGVDPLINYNGLEHRIPGKELNIMFGLRVAKFFFWNNRVHGMTDEFADSGTGGQFRTVGWEYDFGVNFSNFLKVSWYHHSQHILDSPYAPGHFPVVDGLKINLIFYTNPKKPNSLF